MPRINCPLSINQAHKRQSQRPTRVQSCNSVFWNIALATYCQCQQLENNDDKQTQNHLYSTTVFPNKSQLCSSNKALSCLSVLYENIMAFIHDDILNDDVVQIRMFSNAAGVCQNGCSHHCNSVLAQPLELLFQGSPPYASRSMQAPTMIRIIDIARESL